MILNQAKRFYFGDKEVDKIFIGSKEIYSSAVWTVEILPPTFNNTFSVILNNGTNPRFTIDWGDGSSPEIFTTLGSKTHLFVAPGYYSIKIKGGYENNGHIILGNNSLEAGLVTNISKIPKNFNLTTFANSFLNCNSLLEIPTNLFENYNSTSFNSCFRNCESIKTIPSNLFKNQTNVTSYTDCFRGCSQLTAIPDDLFKDSSNAQFFIETFRDCSSLTIAPSTLFESQLNATTFIGCFSNVTLTTQSYSNILINIASNILLRNPYVLFGGGNSKYNTAGEVARNNIILARSWTFLDGGLE